MDRTAVGRRASRPCGAAALPSWPGFKRRPSGRISGGASGREDQVGWVACVPRRRESAGTGLDAPAGPACLDRGGGACNRMKRTPAGAVTVSAYGRWGARGVRAGGETAVRHRSDRVRSRAGAGPDSRGGNGTNPQPRISSKADWADRARGGDQIGRGGARTISRIGMQAGSTGRRYEIFKYINNNARVKIQ